MGYKKKLIEVAIPLEAINAASAREKSIRHGHPSTLHLWWARRPLAACRAVLFAQLVDDPSSKVEELLADPSLRAKAEAELPVRVTAWEASKAKGTAAGVPKPTLADVAVEIERKRLFAIIEELVLWENSTNEEVLERARAEIRKSCGGEMPPVYDPFSGGCSIPLEAQRLGLPAYGSDLNPVAVMIGKAMIEIPPKFKDMSPIHPGPKDRAFYRNAEGLAEDVKYYGEWMREKAWERIGHLYPQVDLPAEYGGGKATVIAWIWARTVPSPDPAYADVQVPIASSFLLSSKAGKEAWIEPVVDKAAKTITYRIRHGGTKAELAAAKEGTKAGRGANFCCLMSDTAITPDHVKRMGREGHMGQTLLAIVAEGNRRRAYIAPTEEHSAIARSAKPDWKPETSLPNDPRNFWTVDYGLTTFGDLFTNRQLVALNTFSDLVHEARAQIEADVLGARASRPRSEWHKRRLPHWEAGEVAQAITFRLADSLPRQRLAQLDAELAALPEDQQAAERRRRIEALLDAGDGARHLENPVIARLVEEALQHFDGTRYMLHDWVVMPTHVHVLITPLHGESLSAILHSWKSWTAKKANAALGRTGAFWQEEYFDRVIRNDDHFNAQRAYIHANPVKAGLAAAVEEWPYSSAREEDWRAGRPPSPDMIPLRDGGKGAKAYAEAVSVYLGFAVGKLTDIASTICTWHSGAEHQKIRQTFGRQALPMTWDYAEGNVFSDSSGNFFKQIELISRVVGLNFVPAEDGKEVQRDAQSVEYPAGTVISTDPPYYDNIGYADLSDYFFCWMKPALKSVYPDVFGVIATPKAEELVATPYRHGGKEAAELFFLDGMRSTIANMAQQSSVNFPATIYYAFKQSEVAQEGISSTGWATFLQAVVEAGYAVVGTWPMRTEMANRMIASGTNALANSVVLVCRKKDSAAATITRAEFIRALKRELPPSIAELQAANIAPADMPQSAIGPGMGVFSRYKAVLEADDSKMSVKTALQLINAELDEYLGGIQGEFDADTRFAITWFEQNGMGKGDYGVADNLARARGISVESVKHAGIVDSAAGKVRLLKRDELRADWLPEEDGHLTIWECLAHLVRLHEAEGLSHNTALLLKRFGPQADAVKDLAYCLYDIAANKRREAAEATPYNALIADWSELSQMAATVALEGRNRQMMLEV